jgi:hypothetical protein
VIFSSKRNLPSLSLKVDNICVTRSNSYLYLGLPWMTDSVGTAHS